MASEATNAHFPRESSIWRTLSGPHGGLDPCMKQMHAHAGCFSRTGENCCAALACPAQQRMLSRNALPTSEATYGPHSNHPQHAGQHAGHALCLSAYRDHSSSTRHNCTDGFRITQTNAKSLWFRAHTIRAVRQPFADHTLPTMAALATWSLP